MTHGVLDGFHIRHDRLCQIRHIMSGKIRKPAAGFSRSAISILKFALSRYVVLYMLSYSINMSIRITTRITMDKTI